MTDLQYYPDNSNLTFISSDRGSVFTIPNLLHFDSCDRQINTLKVFEAERINQLAVASSGEEIAVCGEGGRLKLLNTK